MSNYIGTNNTQSTLAAGLTDTATTLTIQSYDIAQFPVVNNGGVGDDYTFLTLQDSANDLEIVKVTQHDVGSSDFLIERGQDGTTARAWSIGDSVSLRITAGMINAFFGGVNAAQSAAGEAAASAGEAAASVNGIDPQNIVHLDDAQTLAGKKTFTAPIGVGAGWTIAQVGSALVFSYGNVARMQLTSTGVLSVANDAFAGGV